MRGITQKNNYNVGFYLNYMLRLVICVFLFIHYSYSKQKVALPYYSLANATRRVLLAEDIELLNRASRY